MIHPIHETWAKLLVHYGCTVQASENVAIHIDSLAEPMARALYREVLRAGANPVLRMVYPEVLEDTLELASDTLLQREATLEPYRGAPGFYAAFICSIAIGVVLDFSNVNPVSALYWTAVINGVLAPFLLVGILIAASDRQLMHNQPSPLLGRLIVGFTTVVMFGAAIGMFIF